MTKPTAAAKVAPPWLEDKLPDPAAAQIRDLLDTLWPPTADNAPFNVTTYGFLIAVIEHAIDYQESRRLERMKLEADLARLRLDLSSFGRVLSLAMSLASEENTRIRIEREKDPGHDCALPVGSDGRPAHARDCRSRR